MTNAGNGAVQQIMDLIQVEAQKRSLLEGPKYASPIEGYGDLTAALTDVEEALKKYKREGKLLLGMIREADPQGLYEKLTNCRVEALRLTDRAVRMAAAVERNLITIQHMMGGDLLDQLEMLREEEDDDE